ncbi:MAG: HPr kinase/phosphatase C-terminal domain-containing protein [Rhodobacter sp.]|nr:HPr kinase/phosphatase C-terminal domain-containing protein [Rhodobacter sp.]
MLFHASCVSVDDRAVLIQGKSGSGKSALALELLAFGAKLVADDMTEVIAPDGWPIAQSPSVTTRGLVEARGVGLLSVAPASPARLHLVVDLNHTETARLPPERFADILGQRMPLLHKVESLHFGPAILQYLKGGRAQV